MRISALVFVCAALLLAWPVSAIAQSDDVSALLERVEALYDQGKYKGDPVSREDPWPRSSQCRHGLLQPR